MEVKFVNEKGKRIAFIEIDEFTLPQVLEAINEIKKHTLGEIRFSSSIYNYYSPIVYAEFQD